MKTLFLSSLLFLGGCGAGWIHSERTVYAADGSWTHEQTDAPYIHVVSDPAIARAKLPPGVELEGFQGRTVVDGIKAMFSGIVEGLSKLVAPK